MAGDACVAIDGHIYAALTFGEAGIIAGKANSKEDRINQAQQAISQAGEAAALFGDNKKPGATSAAAPQDGFTSETVEVEFTDPAKHSEVVRRELIDRIGAVARAKNTAATAPLTRSLHERHPSSTSRRLRLGFRSGTAEPSNAGPPPLIGCRGNRRLHALTGCAPAAERIAFA